VAIEILKAGPLCTVQDGGRTGYQALGYQESGAMDKYAMYSANILAGNTASYRNDAVLECTLAGITARFDAPAVIALTGADMSPAINDKAVLRYAPLFVRAGDTLTMGMAVKGLRGYLAIYGGISIPAVMGSRSTGLKTRMGGLDGRALQNGDVLPVGKTARESEMIMRRIRREFRGVSPLADGWEWLRGEAPLRRFSGSESITLLRIVPGPQEEAFTPAGIEIFSRGVYTLTTDCNRMALKLDGPAVETIKGSDILSDGIVDGSVQISSKGMPIIMTADHQTTGGYAKIGTVIRADLPAAAQMKPGDRVGFRFVTPEAGILAWRNAFFEMEKLKERIRK
jgi:antagonist of KipI